VGPRRARCDDGIGKNTEVGPAAEAIDNVGGMRITRVKMSQRDRCEMASGRKPNDSNAVGANAETSRIRSDLPNRSLDVQQRRWVAIARGDPVGKDKTRYAE